MQRHQFCAAALSRNCAPGFMHRVLSGPFEDGSILGTSVRGGVSGRRPGPGEAECVGQPVARPREPRTR